MAPWWDGPEGNNRMNIFYLHPDPVVAYRRYYINDKRDIAQ